MKHKGAIIVAGIILMMLVLAHLIFVRIDEPHIVSANPDGSAKGKLDIKGTISIIRGIPGIFPLILFT